MIRPDPSSRRRGRRRDAAACPHPVDTHRTAATRVRYRGQVSHLTPRSAATAQQQKPRQRRSRITVPTAGRLGAGVALTARQRWIVVCVASAGLLILGIDTMVLNVALPSIQRDFGTDAAGTEWITDGYTIAIASLALAAGSWADRHGRRLALVIGMGVCGVASVAGALGGSTPQLVIARVVMGVGGALIMPSTLSIITNVCTDPEERRRAVAVWTTAAGLGVVLGPVVGGALVQTWSWRAGFWVNVPIIAATVALALMTVPESRDRNAPPPDLRGIALATVGLCLTTWAVIDAPNHGWTSAFFAHVMSLAVAVLVGFWIWERRCEMPMVPLEFLRNIRFTVSAVTISLLIFGMLGVIFLLTMYLQGVMGYSPVQAGLHLLPMAGAIGVGNSSVVVLARLVGDKIAMAIGAALMAAGFCLFARTQIDSGYARLALVLALLGLGIGMAVGPATEAVMSSFPEAHAGIGSALNDTTREIGAAMGVAVLGSVLHTAYSSHMAPHVGGLPSGVADPAKDSLFAALEAARAVPVPDQALALVHEAKLAFIHALDRSAVVGAVVTVVGMLVVTHFMPHRAPAQGPAEQPAENTAENASDAVAGSPTESPAQEPRETGSVPRPAWVGAGMPEPGLREPRLREPGLHTPGRYEPSLREPGLHEPGLAASTLTGSGLTGAGSTGTGFSRSVAPDLAMSAASEPPSVTAHEPETPVGGGLLDAFDAARPARLGRPGRSGRSGGARPRDGLAAASAHGPTAATPWSADPSDAADRAGIPAPLSRPYGDVASSSRAAAERRTADSPAGDAATDAWRAENWSRDPWAAERRAADPVRPHGDQPSPPEHADPPRRDVMAEPTVTADGDSVVIDAATWRAVMDRLLTVGQVIQGDGLLGPGRPGGAVNGRPVTP